MSDIWVVNGKTWYSKAVIDKIIAYCHSYTESCKENCIDDRMCSSCYWCSGVELAEEIFDLLEVNNAI